MSPLCVCEEGIFIGAGCQLVRLSQAQNGLEQWTQEQLDIITQFLLHSIIIFLI